MLKFKLFIEEVYAPHILIMEEFLLEEKDNRENDDMGKLHEILFLKHVHDEPQMPKHHRSEGNEDPAHNGDPQSVHDEILKRMKPEKYKIVDEAAKQSAEEWRRKNLKPGESVSDATWSSNRDIQNEDGSITHGDHWKTTNIDDPNSQADGILRITDKKTGAHKNWKPISLKIGKNDPNLFNGGMKTLEKMSGHEAGEMSKLEDPHTEKLKELGYHPDNRSHREAQWKADSLATTEGVDGLRKHVEDLEKRKAAGKKLESKHKLRIQYGRNWLDSYDNLSMDKKQEMLAKAKNRHDTAVQSGLDTKRTISKKFAEGMAKKIKTNPDGSTDDSELRTSLLNTLAPKTVFPTSLVYSRLSSDGKKSTPEVHNDMTKKTTDHINSFHNLTVDPGDGITTYIKGNQKNERGELILDKKGKPKVVNIAKLSMKNSSGPASGVVSAFSLTNVKKPEA